MFCVSSIARFFSFAASSGDDVLHCLSLVCSVMAVMAATACALPQAHEGEVFSHYYSGAGVAESVAPIQGIANGSLLSW